MVYKKTNRINKHIYTTFFAVDEESDSIRLRRLLDVKFEIICFVIALIFQIVFANALIYMIHNQQGVFYIFVGVVANLFIFCCLIAPIIDISDRAKYSLVINRQGIKNTTCRDEVFLPWTEFEKISILENVKIRGNRGYDYYTFIYISNSDLDEDYLRKIIKSNASHIYITAESKLVITIWPYSKEETEALYSKLTEYINKFNPQNAE